jgi:hypothetical protein
MPYLGNNLGVAFSSYKLIDSLTASFNGTTTSFALTVNGVTPVPFPLNEQNILLSVGGVPQKPDSTGTEGFRFSGSNIVFSSAPKTGEAFWGVVLAGADRVNAGVQYPDGTASAPSISFASQTTTGFYRSGSGQIGVGINGSTPVAFSTSGVQLNGSTSGSVIIASPAVAGNNTLTLPTSDGTSGQFLQTNGSGALTFASAVINGSSSAIVSGTAQNSTSGTSIDFTGIPSYVKRITVMFYRISTNGTSSIQVQLGDSGGIEATGYEVVSTYINNSADNAAYTSGFVFKQVSGVAATGTQSGQIVFNLVDFVANTWTGNGALAWTVAPIIINAGSKALSGTLDRVRITTVNGTDTFDAGSINILYE